MSINVTMQSNKSSHDEYHSVHSTSSHINQVRSMLLLKFNVRTVVGSTRAAFSVVLQLAAGLTRPIWDGMALFYNQAVFTTHTLWLCL